MALWRWFLKTGFDQFDLQVAKSREKFRWIRKRYCFPCAGESKGIDLAFASFVGYLDLGSPIVCWGICNLKWKIKMLLASRKRLAIVATVNSGETSITVFKSLSPLEDDICGRQDCVTLLSRFWNVFLCCHELKDGGSREEKENRKSSKRAWREQPEGQGVWSGLGVLFWLFVFFCHETVGKGYGFTYYKFLGCIGLCERSCIRVV